jgi:hypothetical protein
MQRGGAEGCAEGGIESHEACSEPVRHGVLVGLGGLCGTGLPTIALGGEGVSMRDGALQRAR